MSTGATVAIGVGILALAVVAYFMISNKSTPSAAPRQAPAKSGDLVSTVGQVATGVGALANLGGKIVDAASDN